MRHAPAWFACGAITFLSACTPIAGGLSAPRGELERLPMPIQAHIAQRGGPSGLEWNVEQIRAFRTSSLATASLDTPPIVVAVLDTGADPAQPDLAHVLYPGIDVVGNDPYTVDGTVHDYTGRDGNGHGTHVAGIIAQVVGDAAVRVLPVKVIPHTGVGDDLLLANGIERALAWRDPSDPNVRVRIMNMSVSSPRASQRLERIIRQAKEEGVLMVGASGNDGKAVEFPASMAEVLSVGATDREDRIAAYSCFGDALDLAAPGGSDDDPVYSTWPSYLTASDLDEGVGFPHTTAGLVGTSMAAPHVAGAAALLWAQRPGLNLLQVRQGLLAMADDLGTKGPDPYFGFGRLNVQRSLGSDRHDAH